MVCIGGFPHSEIFGSKVAYRLPEAYRRLLRPSSAFCVKASTIRPYFFLSLDSFENESKINRKNFGYLYKNYRDKK